MARARSIKPGFFKNADLLDLPFEARLLFAGLWTLADRGGRLEDKPKQIKIEIFPGDNVDCDALLTSIANTGMLMRYVVDGVRYLQIVNFSKHQNPHKDERPSTIPSHATNSVATNAALAQHNANTVPIQSKHHASTVQAQADYVATSEVVGLTPDSLFLDSHNLTPDCSTKTNTPSLPRDPQTDFSGSTKPGAVCVVLKSEGVSQVNPGHPDLLELLESGAQLSDFVAACEIAAGANKLNFGYVLGIVRRRLDEAKKPAKARKKFASNAEREIETFKERDERRMRKNWEDQTGRVHPDNIAEQEAEQDQKTVTSKTAFKPFTALHGAAA